MSISDLEILANPAVFVLAQYAVPLLVIAVAWALGSELTRRVSYRSELEAHVLSTTCGLGALATGLFFLAILGVFRHLWVVAFLLSMLVVSRRSWGEVPAILRRWLAARHSTAAVVLVVLVALAAGPLAVLPLYPPTEFDATMFHLPFSESIVRGQQLDFFSDLRYPVLPALQHVLYALGLVLGSDVTPAVLHTAALVLLALLLFAWGRDLSSSRAGLWAALLWLTTPVAVWTATAAYVDCALALFVVAALLCLVRYARRREAAWLLLGAAFAAFGAGTKYHGLFFVTVFVLTAAALTLREGRPKRALLAASLAALLMLPWYGYVTYYTYNPVFPFLPQVFGWSPWAFELQYQEADGPPQYLQDEAGLGAVAGKLGRNVRRSDNLRVLALPVNLFLHPERFSGRSASPLYALTPFLIIGLAVRRRHALFLGGVAAVYGFLWAHSALDMRYLLPVLPLAALLGAEGLDRLLRWRPGSLPRWPGFGIGVAVTLVLVGSLMVTTARIAFGFGSLPTYREARLDFVQSRHRALGAIRAHNRLSPRGSRVYGLFCENLRHYSKRKLIGEWNGENRFVRVFRHLDDPAELHARLRAMPVGYLVLPDTERWRKGRLENVDIPSASELDSHFELLYSDPWASLYRLRTVREIVARRQAGRVEGEAATGRDDEEDARPRSVP